MIYDMLIDSEQYQQKMESNNSVENVMIKLSSQQTVSVTFPQRGEAVINFTEKA